MNSFRVTVIRHLQYLAPDSETREKRKPLNCKTDSFQAYVLLAQFSRKTDPAGKSGPVGYPETFILKTATRQNVLIS